MAYIRARLIIYGLYKGKAYDLWLNLLTQSQEVEGGIHSTAHDPSLVEILVINEATYCIGKNGGCLV